MKETAMKLGFLGTGTIADAVIRGIFASDLAVAPDARTTRGLQIAQGLQIDCVAVSPRNAQIAGRLAADFSAVKVAKDNQEVVDGADLVFVALRAQITREILSALTFHKGQKIVSFVPTATCAMLSSWISDAAPVLRAVPLPFVAQHKSATPIFPADRDLRAIFAKIGGVIEAKDEQQFNLFMTAGSLMGVYFRFAGICDEWMQQQGLMRQQSALYLARLFASLADAAAEQPDADFKVLQQEYSTKGGTNELIARLFEEKGGASALCEALDQAFAHISKG